MCKNLMPVFYNKKGKDLKIFPFKNYQITRNKRVYRGQEPGITGTFPAILLWILMPVTAFKCYCYF